MKTVSAALGGELSAIGTIAVNPRLSATTTIIMMAINTVPMRLNGWQRIGLVALIVLVGATSFAEATCGDLGGPGYRRPNGKCVGWE
jgi:hypothetical protein